MVLLVFLVNLFIIPIKIISITRHHNNDIHHHPLELDHMREMSCEDHLARFGKGGGVGGYLGNANLRKDFL